MRRTNDLPVRTYRADQRPSGLIASLREAANEIHDSRHVIWRLFARDFVVGFRQKVLGYLWIVIAPLIGIASFVFMYWAGILNPGNVPISYPLFVFFGTSMWGVITATLGATSAGLLSNAELMMRTNIPRIALALNGIANVLYGILVNSVVLVLLLALFRTAPAWTAAFYPITLVPLLVFGIGLGLILAVLGAVARDVSGIVTTGFGLFMYLTPAVYTLDFKQAWLRELVRFNPLAYLVDEPRNLFFLGYVADPFAYTLSCLFAFGILALGIHGFYLIKDLAAERL